MQKDLSDFSTQDLIKELEQRDNCPPSELNKKLTLKIKSDIAHDLASPILVLNGSIEKINRTQFDDESFQSVLTLYLGKIEKQVNKMKNIVQDLRKP